MSYQLDAYPEAWAELMYTHLHEELQVGRSITRLGAGRMEDFELLRKTVRVEQGDTKHEVLVGAPDCRLPDDGNYNPIEDDTVALAWLRAHLPEAMVAAVDAACSGEVEPSEWLEALEEEHGEWYEAFVDLVDEMASNLHVLALARLRDRLVATGHQLAGHFEMVLFEHDGESPVELEECELELGVLGEQAEALARLFFEADEGRTWFLRLAQGD